MDTSWIVSNGGPLILLPRSLLAAWDGINPPRDGREKVSQHRWDPNQRQACDYDRACDVTGYTGVLRIGDGWGLIIGDEPLPTRWIQRDDGGVLVRWIFAPSEVAVELVIDEMPERLPWEAEGCFEVLASPLELFDSAEPGVEPLVPRSVIELAGGRYRIDQATYTQEPDISLHLIRLRRDAVLV